MTDTKERPFKILDRDVTPSPYSQDSWLVEVDGKRFMYETWSTDNASGAEWYDPDTQEVIEGPDRSQDWYDDFEQACFDYADGRLPLTLTKAQVASLTDLIAHDFERQEEDGEPFDAELVAVHDLLDPSPDRTRCKDCGYVVAQQMEKALGDGSWAVVWMAGTSWICPSTGDEHVPVEAERDG